MKPFRSVPKSISAFIAHVSKDDAEAFRYKAALEEKGFGTYLYETDSGPGDLFYTTISQQIGQAAFFCLLVTPSSRKARIVPRELGYALSVYERTQHYQPVIIPLYAEPLEMRARKNLPATFPVRDFHTNTPRQPFRLDQVRGFDRQAQPKRDSDEI